MPAERRISGQVKDESTGAPTKLQDRLDEFKKTFEEDI
jgi:hypothetical protein